MPDHFPLTSGRLSIRRLTGSDADMHLLHRWLSNTRVLEFYEGRDHSFTFEDIRASFSPENQGEETACILEWEGQPIGYLQYGPLDEDCLIEYGMEGCPNAYGIDLFIGEPEHWNRGLGTQIVQLAASHLFDHLSASHVTLDPRANNPRAVRCYEKSGFMRVRLLPAHELHEGTLVDCWLMVKARPER